MANQKVYHIEWKFGPIMGIIPKNKICLKDVVHCFGNDAMTLGATCKPDIYPLDYPLKNKDEFGGIDIPCLLKSDKEVSKDTIMIIGEAPRRKAGSPKFSLGTPYGIQYDGYPPQCDVYKDIFKCLLGEGYNLYLTDAIKVWTNNKQTNRKLLVPDCTDYNILKEEINAEKPCKIVTFGRVAMNAVRTVYNNLEVKPPLCHLYHPSHIAIRHWKRKSCVKSFPDVPCVVVCLIKRRERVNMFNKEWKFNK